MPPHTESVIVLTFDVDWAVDEVVRDTVELLTAHNLPATFFCTHLLGADIRRLLQKGSFEIGLHPHVGNENDLSLRGSLDQLREWYPKAVAARSHSLLSSTPILRSYKAHGIAYASNVVARRTPHLHPLPAQWGIRELPIYEMDYFILAASEDALADDPFSLQLEKPGLKIFCFHPIHLFLNCRTLDDYENARPVFGDYEKLLNHQKSGYGIRTYVHDLIRRIKESNLRVCLLSEASDLYPRDLHG